MSIEETKCKGRPVIFNYYGCGCCEEDEGGGFAGHIHDNMVVLDKLGESEDGKLLYNGEELGNCQCNNTNGSLSFETEWFDIATSGVYTFDLPEKVLNIEPEKRHARLMAKVKADIGDWKVGDIFTVDTANRSNQGTWEFGSAIIFRNNKAIVSFGNTGEIISINPSGGLSAVLQKAHVQIKLLIDIGLTNEFDDEEMAMQKAMLQWSKAELDTEYWTGCYDTDGKKIYGKKINFGTLPNNTTKEVPHNVTNIHRLRDVYGSSINSADSLFVLPFSHAVSVGSNIELYATPTIVGVRVGANMSDFTDVEITILYTCTDK